MSDRKELNHQYLVDFDIQHTDPLATYLVSAAQYPIVQYPSST